MGKIIELEDGRLLRIDAVDSITSSLWLPTSNVIICDDKLINSDDGESVLLTDSNPNVALLEPRAFSRPSIVRRRTQAMGGLNEQELKAAREAIDPEHKLTDSQRNVAALGSVYQFWANKGEPDKAQRVAFQMLRYYRNTSQRYAVLVAKAAEGGTMDLATKAALKAYENVPDGRDLELSQNPDGGLLYTYTDEKGNVIDRGIATPQQLVSSAMGLALNGFDEAILEAAGVVDLRSRSQKRKGTQ